MKKTLALILSILMITSSIPINTTAAPSVVATVDSAREIAVPDRESQADDTSETKTENKTADEKTYKVSAIGNASTKKQSTTASLFTDTSENGYKVKTLNKAVIYTDDLYRQLKATYITDASITKESATISMGPYFQATGSGSIRYWSKFSPDWGRLNLVTSSSTIASANETMLWRGHLSAVDPTTQVILGAKRMDGNSYIAMTDYYGEQEFVKRTEAGETTFNLTDLNGWGVIKTKGGVWHPYVVLIDNNAPSIIGYELSDDGEELYIYYDDVLRLAHSKETNLDDFYVTVKYVNSKSGVEAGELVYRGVSIKDGNNNSSRLTLRCGNVPTGEYTITEIVSSGTPGLQKFEVYGVTQCKYYYAYSRGDESIYENTGNPIVTLEEIDGWAPLTDYAGNTASLPGKTDVESYNLSWDTKSPVVENISATGSMSSKLNTSEQNSWPEDIDLSAVYAGTGDKMYFDVKFDEPMGTLGSIVLNVNKNGKAVTLSNPTVSTSKNANGDTCTVAHYGPVTFDTEYSMASDSAVDYIAVAGFSGTFRDASGNSLNESGSNLDLKEKIYLDASAPAVSKATLATGNQTNKFTIMVEMSDEGSGFIELTGKLGISAGEINDTVSYEMAITDSLSEPSEYKYSGILGKTVTDNDTSEEETISGHDIPLYSGERYIHIKLDENKPVSITDIVVEYSIPDWAGNVSKSAATKVTPEYTYDNIAPELTVPTIYVGYGDTTAQVTASWKTTDLNSDLGVTTYYQWSDTKPANYSDGWLTTADYDATQYTSESFWMTNPSEAPQLSEGTDTKLTLWVYAIDEAGNMTEMKSASTTVTLTKPSVILNYPHNTEFPVNSPMLELGAAPNPNTGAEAPYGYVRVFVDFDTETTKDYGSIYEKTHVLIYSSEVFEEYENGTANLFELLEAAAGGELEYTIPYYTVTLSNDGESFGQVNVAGESGDFYDVMQNWYGNVTVTYDAIFSSSSFAEGNYSEFVPKSDTSLSSGIENGSYLKNDTPITFAYSGDIDDIYDVAFDIPQNANGEELVRQTDYSGNYAQSYYTGLFYKTLGGASVNFSAANTIIPAWGVNDVDMSASYLSLIKLGENGEETEVAKLPVICSDSQEGTDDYISFGTVVLPYMEYTTGTYVLELVLTTYAGSSTVKRLEEAYLVVDNEKAPEIGVWDTYITPGISLYSGLPRVVRYDENGKPVLEITEYNSTAIYDTTAYKIENNLVPGEDEAISGMSVSLAGKQQENRNELYVSESAGAENFGFTVSVLEEKRTEKLQTIGEVQKFYIWNPEIHESREDGFVIEGSLTYSFDGGNASDNSTWTYDADTGIGTSVINTDENGIYALASELGIKAGDNRICMQVVMANGNESPIEQFAISVTEGTPEAVLGVYPRVSLAQNDTNNIVWADINLNNVFSSSGIHGAYVLSKNKVVLVEPEEVYDEETETYRETENLTEYERYSYKNTLEALGSGYYDDILGINGNSFAYWNSPLNQFIDKNGNTVTDPEYHIHTWGNNYHYQMIPVDADATVRIEGDDYFHYGLATGEEGTVTNKLGDYNATSGMLVIDESGASVFMLPQFNSANGNASFVDGYSPKHTLTNSVLGFYDNARYTTTLYASDVWNNTITLTTSVKKYDYVDHKQSYIEFTDEDGTVIESFYFTDEVSLPNAVGYDGMSQDIYDFNFDIVAPIADGVNNQAGDLCDDLWAQVFLYDMNVGEYLETDRIQLKRPSEATYSRDFVYASRVPEVSTNIIYLGEVCLHFDTSVQVETPESSTGGWNFNWYVKNEKDYTPGTVTFTDARGNRFTENYNSTYYADNSYPYVDISTLKKSTQPVVVTITPNESWPNTGNISVTTEDAWDYDEGLSWERNEETGVVTATLTKSTYLNIMWNIGDGTVTQECRVQAVVQPDVGIEWSYGQSTNDYAHGNVTAYVVDLNKEVQLIDPMTGETPQYTFEYGSGVTEYTWPAVCIGSATGTNIGSVTATLEVELQPLAEQFVPREEYDKRQPSVQVIPFTMQRNTAVPLNMKYVFEDREERYSDTQIDYLNPDLTAYEDFTLYTDAVQFSENLGWGNMFRFKVEAADVNLTKTVIKAGLDAEAPESYASASSDEIYGVTLMGSMIDVNANAEFTVFVIDRENNVTAVPITVSEIADAPKPEYKKILWIDPENGDEYIIVELIAPEDGSNLYITKVDGVETDYAEFSENGTYTVDYEYTYFGNTVIGQLEIDITEIDESKKIPPQLVSIVWSANKSKATSQDVVATLTFDKTVTYVYIDNPSDNIEVLTVGSKATVRYKDNTPSVNLYFESIYGLQSAAIEMSAVTNIDRIAPVVTVDAKTLSDDGRSVTVSFTANEKVSFREAGKAGTQFQKKYSENGTYTCTFTDMAGNTYKTKFTVDGIVKTLPKMSFSFSEDGAYSVSTPDELGTVNIGDTFFVSVDRDAKLSFSGDEKEAVAGTWTEFTVGNLSGGAITAKDMYGNIASAVFTHIEYPDITPPMLQMKHYTVYGSMLDLDALDEAVKANVVAVDDRDREVPVTAEYTTPASAGQYTVTYTAYDNSGNKATAVGKIYVYETTAPGVAIDGKIAERDSIYIAEHGDALKLTVDMQGEPYTVDYKNGIKTVAQMKIGSTPLAMQNGEINLPFAGAMGYYTILITTQNHDSYRVTVYVK